MKGQIYTIGDAVRNLQKTHPEVSHSSLRFLERLGFVRPLRTRGGHRQFSEADLDRIRTIKDWQDQNFTLEQIGQRLERLGAMPGLRDISQAFVTSALAGEFHQATTLVLQADDLGVPPRDIFGEILTPALTEIGDRWLAGELGVGQEHEVSELCRDLISEITMRHMQQPQRSLSVLAACVEGELHDLGLRMVCGLLRQAGVTVHFLGVNLPTSFLAESVAMRQPGAVLLSATLRERRPALSRAIDAVRSAGSAAIFVGGQAFADSSELDGEPDIHISCSQPLPEAVDDILRLQPA